MLSLALTACFALGAGDRGALPDRVTLDDGTTPEGRVLFEDEQTLVLRVKSRDREIDRSGISAVRAASQELPRALDRLEEPDNRLYVDASSGLQPEALVHEATHQILYNGAVKGSQGFCSDVPAWLDEGLAVTMQAARSGDPGRLVVRSDTLDPRWFSIHAQAEKPYDLSRVLNFDTTDFQASSRADLKYAQSYSLVCFLMYGAQGRHRAGFMEFVKGVYRGKTSSTHFERAMDVRERDLEKAWHAFADGMAR